MKLYDRKTKVMYFTEENLIPLYFLAVKYLNGNKSVKFFKDKLEAYAAIAYFYHKINYGDPHYEERAYWMEKYIWRHRNQTKKNITSYANTMTKVVGGMYQNARALRYANWGLKYGEYEPTISRSLLYCYYVFMDRMGMDRFAGVD